MTYEFERKEGVRDRGRQARDHYYSRNMNALAVLWYRIEARRGGFEVQVDLVAVAVGRERELPGALRDMYRMRRKGWHRTR